MAMILLDTCTLLWSLGEMKRLSHRVRLMLDDGSESFCFSQISLIEIQIKHGSNKLDLKVPPHRIPEAAREAGFEYCPLTNAAIFNLAKLPKIHRDPFDRLLIGEVMAMGEETKLCTPDATIRQYPVEVLW